MCIFVLTCKIILKLIFFIKGKRRRLETLIFFQLLFILFLYLLPSVSFTIISYSSSSLLHFVLFVFLNYNLFTNSMASSLRQSKSVSYHSPSMTNCPVRMCECNAHMILYHCKNERNKRRIFWRCPFW